MLSVERGEGSVLEVGEIYFVSGTPTYASLAGLRGREALLALGNWGPCRFAFDTEATPPPPNIVVTDPTLHAAQRNQPSSTPPMGNRVPATGNRMTGRLQTRPLGPQHISSANQYGAFTPPNQYGSFTPPNQYGAFTPPNQYGAFTPPNNTYANADSLGRRPRRAPDVRDLMAVVTTYNLSRNHRTVLLLADGEHSILDLARLSSKSVDEVTGLLADLESRGLIYYYATE